MTNETQIIKLRRSNTPGAVPTISQLQEGELAVNIYDGKLFFIRNDGTANVIAVANYTEGSAGPSAPNDGDRWLNTDTSILFTWVVDTGGGQWVEL